MSITESVLRWINRQTLPATFSIGSVADECDLDRRQVTTALHSLAKGALGDDLERVGKGMWRYAPTPIRSAEAFDNAPAERFRYTPRDDLRPGETLGQGTIISCTRTGKGFYYTVRDEQGGLWQVTPIYSVDTLLPVPLQGGNRT